MGKQFRDKKVIITTSFRGVYYGRLVWLRANACMLADARMVIYWGTANGVDQLAATGPTDKSKIGAQVPLVRLYGLTSIALVTGDAEAAWAKR
jgi:hypothetical protein